MPMDTSKVGFSSGTQWHSVRQLMDRAAIDSVFEVTMDEVG